MYEFELFEADIVRRPWAPFTRNHSISLASAEDGSPTQR
jgi:hypothetical protein